MFGSIGATIVYIALLLHQPALLTNFQLGEWIRALFEKESATGNRAKSLKEIALEKRALDLEKQRRRLEEQIGQPEKTGNRQRSRRGRIARAEPTVRDLSVPQSKAATGARVRKRYFARTENLR